MKKSILMISLMTVAMAVFAIDYPTYKPTTPSYSGGSSGNGTGDDDNTGTTYGGYSTTTSGGVTTYGEGAATGPARGPRRAEYNGSGTPNTGDTWTINEEIYYYYDNAWHNKFGEIVNPGPQDPGSPIGTPLVMLLFAAMAAVVVYLRKRKNLVTE